MAIALQQVAKNGRGGVYFFPDAWSERKEHVIINKYRQYLLRYDIDAIVVKVPPSKDHSKALRRLLDRIARLARKHGCAYDLITKAELKSRTALRSTEELIAYACRLYPQLSAQYRKGLASGHKYDRKMYEAILSAHIVGEWLSHRTKSNDK